MTQSELQALSGTERDDLEKRGAEVQKELALLMRRISQLEREGAELLVKLDRESARFAIQPLLHGLRDRHAEQPDVVAHLEAVRDGRFHVWAVDRIDEGIEILTGIPAGEPLPDGTYVDETIHAVVATRLEKHANVQAAFARCPNGDGQPLNAVSTPASGVEPG